MRAGYASCMNVSQQCRRGESLGCLAVVGVLLAAPDSRASLGWLADDDIVDTLEEVQALEARYRAGADRAVASSVAVLMSPMGSSRGSTGSGTIISDDGWVMTAGHVGDAPGRPCRVKLHDGTELNGVTAGQVFQGLRDWGLIKVDPKGVTLVPAPMQSPASLEAGAWMLVFGHTYGPELDKWIPPAMRMGRMLAQDEVVLLIDAPFASGDSGGGVFTADGTLIGIVSSAGGLSWQSTVSSLAPVLPDLDRLKSELPAEATAAAGALEQVPPAAPQPPDESGTTGPESTPMPDSDGADAPAPEGEAPPPDQGERPRRGRRRGPDFDRTRESEDAVTRESRVLLGAVADTCLLTAVSVGVVYVHDHAVALATVVDDAGHVLTKRSELPADGQGILVTMPDGVMAPATIVAARPEEDLALLATHEPGHAAVDFASAALSQRAASDGKLLDEGMFLVSPGADGMAMSIGAVALRERTTTRRDVTSAFLGVGVREAEKPELEGAGVSSGVLVRTLTRGSPAEAAGVQEGDLLVSVDDVPIPTQQVLGDVVRRHAIGEAMVLELVRDGERVRLTARGAVRPRESGPPASTPDAPSSRRSSGFGSVIQHDSVLASSEIGGPVVDLGGRVVGLNIARVDRTRTYALSADRVARALDVMRVDIAAGRDPVGVLAPLPPIEVSTDSESDLAAAAAEPMGRDLRYSIPTRGAEGSLDGFESPADSIRWQLHVPAEGRYQVDVRYSMPGDRQGPPERVRVQVVGGEGAEATLKKTVRGRFARKLVGDVNLPAGAFVLEVSAPDAPATLAIRSIILTPVKPDAQASDQPQDPQ